MFYFNSTIFHLSNSNILINLYKRVMYVPEGTVFYFYFLFFYFFFNIIPPPPTLLQPQPIWLVLSLLV